MKNILILTSIFFFVFLIHSNAEIYMHVEENGNTVFTDNQSTVPETQNNETMENRKAGDKTLKHQFEDLHTKDVDSNLTQNDHFFLKQLVTLYLVDEETDTSKITHQDLALLKSYFEKEDQRVLSHLRDIGILTENTGITGFLDASPEKWEVLKSSLEEIFGIPFNTVGVPPDRRFSSPEKTWDVYKNALIKGDINLAMECRAPWEREDEKQKFNMFGKEKTRQSASEMRPIEKITRDDERGQYRIKRSQKINGKMMDITYYIEFVNIYGNWKIDVY